MRRLVRLSVFVALAIGVDLGDPGRALAANEPEKRQRRVEEDILPKLVVACGVPLSMTYDGDSLRKNNKDIGYDQTDGSSECEAATRSSRRSTKPRSENW
jgi:hypothetical protein